MYMCMCVYIYMYTHITYIYIYIYSGALELSPGWQIRLLLRGLTQTPVSLLVYVLPRYTITPLHRYTVTPSHHYTVTPLHVTQTYIRYTMCMSSHTHADVPTAPNSLEKARRLRTLLKRPAASLCSSVVISTLGGAACLFKISGWPTSGNRASHPPLQHPDEPLRLIYIYIYI